MIQAKTARQWIHSSFFSQIHNRSLVYNTCWEDPALDRVALDLKGDDRVLTITSAGCNALDYLLAGAGQVHAVDVNPIQNALLELKVAGIRCLSHADFFALFGRGGDPGAREMYGDTLRRELSDRARRYWDRNIHLFARRGWRNSFFFRGTSGLLARLLVVNVRLSHLGRELEAMLAARNLEEQRVIYEKVRASLWSPWLRWFLTRHTTLTLFGVPWPQRDQIVRQYPGGVIGFIQDAFEAVLTRLSFKDNYFWRVYFQGFYEADCCPEYLKPNNFRRLKAGLVDRLRITTSTLTEFLRQSEPGLSKFVLLDHMDWMSCHNIQALEEEWRALLAKARPGSRVIFRSAGLRVHYLDGLRVNWRGRERPLTSLLRYNRPLAEALHARDRVHTYGSFSIADLTEPERD